MGVQAIEAASCGDRIFPVSRVPGAMPAIYGAQHPAAMLRTAGASISPFRAGRRGKHKTASGKSAAAAICVFWILVGTAEGGESDVRPQALVATENGVQEWDRAEALARALTSSLQGELDAVRSVAAAERIKQKHSLELEQRRADTLSQELASLRAEIDRTAIKGLDLVQAAAAETGQKQALEQDRDRIETLTRELTSVQAELYKARAAAAEIARTAEATRVEQERTIGNERDKTEALTRALAATRDELETGKRQISALNARASRASESTVCSERMVDAQSTRVDGNRPSTEQSAGKAAVASLPDRLSERPRPDMPPTTREAAPDQVSKADSEIQQSGPANAARSIPLAEQKLLERANKLLGRADVSSARRLLRYAVKHGSAQAAFLLAETYDTNVWQSQRSGADSTDRAKARELYQRAWDGGIADAKQRIESLK